MGTTTQPDLSQIRAELRQIISNVIGADLADIDEDAPLLDYVTSSMALLEGIRTVHERFGVMIPLRPLLEGAGNLRALSAYIDQEINAHEKTLRAAAKWDRLTGEKDRQTALAPPQRHVGFLARYSAEACSAYNEPLAVRLEGSLQEPALQAAIEAAAERHEAMRAALSPDSDTIALQAERLQLSVSRCSAEELSGRVSDIATQAFTTGERLFRAQLLRLSDTEHVLVLVGHALVVDHEALLILLEDIAELYNAFQSGEKAPTTCPAIELTEYMLRHDGAGENPTRLAAEEYWKKALAHAPRLELPNDHPRPPIKGYAGARLVVPLPPDVREALESWPGKSPAGILFGAFTAVVHRLAGQNDIVVGARGTMIHRNGEQRIVCGTRDMLPVRTTYDAARSFAQHIRSTSACYAQADDHRHIALVEISRLVNSPRDQSRPAVFSAAFRSHAFEPLPAFAALRCSLVTVPIARARYDVELILASVPSGMTLWCDYSTELFDVATVSRWINGLIEFVRAGCAEKDRLCGTLPIMSERERHLLLHEWNASERPYPDDRTTLDEIMDQVRAEPDRIAIRYGGSELTYARLAARIEQIAAALHEHGVRPGERVAVLLRRSPELVAAMLASWRVGAAYVPLDPDVPKKRIAFMVEDAEVRLVVTTRDLSDLTAQSGVRSLCLDATELPAVDTVPGTASRSYDSAYVIYTSGSTGQPKGVEIAHTSLLNCLLGARDVLNFSSSDSLLAITTPSFDISTVELFMPLLAGGILELGEDGLAADGIRLAARIEECKPSYVQATPSTWKAVLAAGWGGDRNLCIGATGEALSRELAEQLIIRGRTVWNLYGPTEITVWAAAHRIVSAPGEPVRIGRPWPNTQLYVLDEQLQPVPIGAIGELYIGGAGLARGYVHRPELTRQRFVGDPFHAGQRLYRTGDLARYLPNGDVICLGRIDHQAKIHGYRVELEEVETGLRMISGICDAVVTAWVDANGDRQLVAHVIATESGKPTTAEIRDRLRETLPEAMVPAYIMFADNFPLTTSGKIDRAALPAPDVDRRNGRTGAAPATPTERQLAEVWSNVLGISTDRIGRDDDFMDLGGHSLLMTRLMVETRRLLHVGFSMRDFFAASTLRKFARLLDELRRTPASQTTSYRPMHARDSEWGKQRMAFLRREAELPATIAPARGLAFQANRGSRMALLTGATGFLGAYVVAEVLRTTDAHLHCLVRPKDDASSKGRIEEQLRQYDLWDESEEWQAAWNERIHAISGDVILPRLGMTDQAFEMLAREVDCIIHSAAHVNFIYPYEALKGTNVLGLHEIIRFAFNGRIKPVHYLSTAAIWPMGAEYTFYESDSLDHGKLLNLGYDEAKWVGERCLINAAERGLPVARYRPGEVGGDSRTGRSVLNHFLTAAFKGFLQFGAFPPIDAHIDIAPVDYVAKAIVHLAFRGNALGRAFHLTNPRSCRMTDALTFLRNAGYEFDIQPFEQLRSRLVDSDDFAENALFPYQAALESMDERSFELPKYDCRHTLRELEGSGILCPPVDGTLLDTYLRYLTGIGYLPRPAASAGHRARADFSATSPANARLSSPAQHATV